MPLSQLPKKAFAIALGRILDNAEAIVSGQVKTPDVVMEDKILARIYDTITFDYSRFVRLLAHTKPNLRILEVGAGTGVTTETILSAISDECGLSAYPADTFTDVSAEFIPAAKERFAHCSNMEFKVLDITQPHPARPRNRITRPHSWRNVIHATPSLRETLGRLRQLLKLDGLLVMAKLCRLTPSTNYIFVNSSGWWLGEEDDHECADSFCWLCCRKPVGFAEHESVRPVHARGERVS